MLHSNPRVGNQPQASFGPESFHGRKQIKTFSFYEQKNLKVSLVETERINLDYFLSNKPIKKVINYTIEGS